MTRGGYYEEAKMWRDWLLRGLANSRARVLTRRAAAIETLGSTTVLCTDKTGTLTENCMSIAELRLKGGKLSVPERHPARKCRRTFILGRVWPSR